MGRPSGSKNQKHGKIEIIIPEVIAEVLPMFDKDKPCAEVCGLPGAAFEQNGHLFSREGHYVRSEDCNPINDEKDVPQSEEYHDYNQVTLQESPKPTPTQSKEIARHIIYGDVA